MFNTSYRKMLKKALTEKTVLSIDVAKDIVIKSNIDESYYLLPVNCEATECVICEVDSFMLTVAWLCLNIFDEVADVDFEDRISQYKVDRILLDWETLEEC